MKIAAFCNLHPLEVRSIADGDAAQGIKGMDPIQANQLTREEIEAGEKDPSHKLKLAVSKVSLPEAPVIKGGRYTPVSRRQDRPNAVAHERDRDLGPLRIDALVKYLQKLQVK